jgi:hypothetical protein
MAVKAPNVTRHGSPRDLADHAVGYSANGESQHSRQSAHSQQKSEHAARDRPMRPTRGGAREFFARTTKQIAKLRGDISLEPNLDRKAKLQRDLELKTALALRLENEIADQGIRS